MDHQQKIDAIFTEDGIKQEFEQTISSRVERFMKVRPHGIVPSTEFARASLETTFLFRDGHFMDQFHLPKL